MGRTDSRRSRGEGGAGGVGEDRSDRLAPSNRAVQRRAELEALRALVQIPTTAKSDQSQTLSSHYQTRPRRRLLQFELPKDSCADPRASIRYEKEESRQLFAGILMISVFNLGAS